MRELTEEARWLKCACWIQDKWWKLKVHSTFMLFTSFLFFFKCSHIIIGDVGGGCVLLFLEQYHMDGEVVHFYETERCTLLLG